MHRRQLTDDAVRDDAAILDRAILAAARLRRERGAAAGHVVGRFDRRGRVDFGALGDRERIRTLAGVRAFASTATWLAIGRRLDARAVLIPRPSGRGPGQVATSVPRTDVALHRSWSIALRSA